MNQQTRVTPLLVIVIVILLIGVGVAGYVYILKQKSAPVTPAVNQTEEKAPASFIGLWMIERVFQKNERGDWKEQIVPPGTAYVEFTENSFCVGKIIAEKFKCESPQVAYTPDGNILNLVLSDKEIKFSARYKLKMVNEKLEIISELSADNKKWDPALKYIVTKVR